MIQFFKSEPRRHIGGADVIEYRQGYNREMQKFYIQLFDRKSKDTIRIFMTSEEFQTWKINSNLLLSQHKKESK